MEVHEQAYNDYQAGMKYKDIAAKYDVSLNTVKSWKTRHWNKQGADKTKNSVHTKTKKYAHKTKLQPAIAQLDESDLNDRQKQFVIEYVRLANATQAYINAYDANYETANRLGSKLLANVGVQDEVKRIRQARMSDLSVGMYDLLDDLAKQAKGDLGNYLDWGSDEIEVIDADTGQKVTKHHSYVALKDKAKVDSSIIKKINIGKDGVVLELYDKNKAQDKLLDMLTGSGQFQNEQQETSEQTQVIDDIGG